MKEVRLKRIGFKLKGGCFSYFTNLGMWLPPHITDTIDTEIDPEVWGKVSETNYEIEDITYHIGI